MANPSITTVTQRTPGAYSTAIQQRVASGHLFTGALPQAAGPVRADSPLNVGLSIYKYAPLAADGGGLFFWNCNEALVCSQIHIDLGAAGDIIVNLVNLDPAAVNADSPTLLSGESMMVEQATGVRFLALDEARFKTVILPYQAIQIITTNSAAAQIAQVVASLERTYVR